MVEVIAMKEGLLLVSFGGFNAITAEMDSIKTIEAYSGAEGWWTESAAVYLDCVDYATTIGDVQYKSCLRKAN
jgi:hypothetical protein